MPLDLDPLPKTWLAEAWSRGFSLDEIVAANPFPEITARQLRLSLKALERSPDADVIRLMSFRLSRLEWQARIRRSFGSLKAIPSVAKLSRAAF